MLAVLVVVTFVRGVPVAVMEVVHVVAVTDRRMTAPGPVLVVVSFLGPGVGRMPGPCHQRDAHTRHEEEADGEQDDRPTRGGLGDIRDGHPADAAHHAASHRLARKLRASSWEVAFGMIIRALISSSPTTRIDTTTVTAVSTARARL